MAGPFSNNPIGGNPIGPDMSSGAEQGGMGRISGPMLTRNLYRNGVDLAFRNTLGDTQLLYLDVNNSRIGVNTSTPTHALQVEGTTRTVNLISDFAKLSGFDLANSTFSAIGNIELNASDAVVVPAFENGTIFIDGNYIATTQSNANIDLTPNKFQEEGYLYNITPSNYTFVWIENFDATIFNIPRYRIHVYYKGVEVYNSGQSNGTYSATPGQLITVGADTYQVGTQQSFPYPFPDVDNADQYWTVQKVGQLIPRVGSIDIINDLNVYGDLYTPGNITLDGTITFGNDDTDAVDFNADINSSIIPDQSGIFSLGSTAKRWKTVNTGLLNGQTISTDLLTVGQINYTKSQGNIIYVAQNGTDTNRGDHILAPVTSIKRALELADASTSGPVVVYVFPGDYEEETPLVIPSNVSIIGTDIRNVNVFPTSYTQSEDVFHLNGETTVANLTVKNFYYDDANNKGHAFRFAPNAIISSRSPYIQNVTVKTSEISSGSTPANIYSDPLGLAGSYSSNSVAVDQINYTQSQVESWVGKLLMTWNGESFPVTFYEIVDVIDEPLDPGAFWRIVLDRTLENAGEEFYQFSIYPNNGETSIVGAAGYVASTDYSRSFLKSSLPPFFDTTVGEDWTCQIGEGLNIVDFVEEDPLDSTWWKVNFKSLATLTNGLPIFTSPTSAASTGTAGRGAWIDGAELNSASVDASMLFHSCTFILPNADAITMTNGVRVEWLNSFTYFANRGLYAVNGITGRTSNDGSTVNYGAEVRSIGSANVYGNYGAVADGADCLMYLIQHNFAYIGTGTDSTNDNSLAIQANEVVELNSGQIHYVTTDHTGAFRVGDSFFIDFETGSTSVNLSSLTANSLNGLVVTTGDDRTFVTGEKVETGNIKISGNTINSLAGNINLTSATGIINLNNSSNVSGDLDIVGNLTFGGNLNLLGNQTSDTLKFNLDFDQDFNPNQSLRYNLGSATKSWLESYFSKIDLDNIKIYDNVIETTGSNSDLELRANGTGVVNFSSSTTVIDNNLTALGMFVGNGPSVINGTFAQNGELVQQGSGFISENFIVGQDISVGQSAIFEEIRVDGNVITTTTSNTDLELRASGTGNVNILNLVEVTNNLTAPSINANLNYAVDTDTTVGLATISSITIEDNFITTNVSNANLELRASENVEFKNNSLFEQSLVVNETTFLDDTSIIGNLLHGGIHNTTGDYLLRGELLVDDILIKDNFISTTSSNPDFELRASGTGNILIPTNALQIDNDLEVVGNTDVQDINIAGTLTHLGTRSQTGNYFQTGNLLLSGSLISNARAQFENILIDGNKITTSLSNSDLELRAAGTGTVLVPSNNVEINNNLFAASILSGNINVDADLVLNEIVIPPSIIEIDDNFISTKISNADLELRAAGTGKILIPNNNVKISNNLVVNNLLTISDATLSGVLIHVGDRVQTGNANIDGMLTITGLSTFDSQVRFENISIDGNVITTTVSNSDLELRAVGSNQVRFESLQIDNNLSADNIVANDIVVDADLQLNEIIIPPSIIEIDDNFISTKISNADLDLRANGSGQLVFNNSTVIDQQLLVNGNINANSNLIINGTLSQTGDRIQQGDVLLNGSLTVNGLSQFDTDVEFEDLLVSENRISTTLSSSNLELRANGTGNILVPSNDVEFLQDAFAGQLVSGNININNTLALDSLESSTDIQIFDNVITTTNSNSNLELRANGTGTVQLQNLTFSNSTIQTSIDNISFSAPTVIVNSTGALKIPVGSTPLTEQGTIKYNSVSGFFEGKNVETITLSGLYSTDRRTSVLAHPTNNTINLTVNNALVGTVAATGLTIHEIQVGDITLKSNEISTNLINPDLELTAPGTGKVAIGDIYITDNIIENSSAGLLTIANTGFGKVKFTGDALAIPAGTTEERPSNPPIGDTRWNTTTSILETWDGGQYISAAGVSAAISETDFNDLLFEYTLIFG